MGIMDELDSADKKIQKDFKKVAEVYRDRRFRNHPEIDRLIRAYNSTVESNSRDIAMESKEVRENKARNPEANRLIGAYNSTVESYSRDIAIKSKKEKIMEILEDNEEGLDEPHVYQVEFWHQGGGRGWELFVPAGTATCNMIMTEREKRIVKLVGGIERYPSEYGVAIGCKCDRISDIQLSSEELSHDEETAISSIKQKISIIKTNVEAEKDCILDIHYNKEFTSTFRMHTSLRNALLLSVSRKNDRMVIQVKDLETEKQSTQQENNLNPDEQSASKSKISFKTLRETIKRVFGRGEDR